MSDRHEIRLSGSGGQGLILAGVILAEAATIYEDKNAVQSQSYGPEARGGASKSEVIISEDDIDYPKATSIDILLSLTQEAANKYYHDVKPTGLAILDDDMVKTAPKGEFKCTSFPIIKTAKETTGRAMVANIIALGIIVAIKDVVSRESIEKAVLSRVPKGTEELNKKALHEGFRLGDGYKS